MKTILIDAREIQSSTGRYIYNLVKYLHLMKQNKFHYKVMVHNTDRLEELLNLGVDFVLTESRKFSISEQTSLLKQISGLSPDLTHFTMVQQPVFYRGKKVTSMLDLTALRFKNPNKNPILFAIKQSVYSYVNKRAAKKSDEIICISEYVKNDVVEYTGISPDKITVTYNSADKITDKSQALDELKGKKFIMYVGRPQPHKNLSRLIEAFKLLNKDHPELYLVLAGKMDPLYEEHKRYVKQQRIKNVLFTDFVTEGQLRWLYENTACYVLPSLSEGFGLPGLEAMSHGAPVASSDATCLPEVYGDSVAYFNPFDIHNMAVVIDKILTDDKYANKLRTLGKQRLGLFSWEKMAKQTFSVYQKALDKKII